MLNPKSYDGAQVLEASGRRYWVVSIQDVGEGKVTDSLREEVTGITKLAKATQYSLPPL